MFTIREAMFEDSNAIAHVHVDSWREAYKGLLDVSTISQFGVDNRWKMWEKFLQDRTEKKKAYIAVHSGKIVGITSWHETADQVEILTLYVLSDFQKKGVGTVLFKLAENQATLKGKKLVAWVLKGNSSTLFYEKMGCKVESVENRNLGNKIVEELLFSKC
jgi:N-acetylglutamate synthase-like GNAT family acetyltransferase